MSRLENEAQHQNDVDAWHRARLKTLQDEDGWLTLVGLFWLEDGPNAVGSTPGATVVLPASVPAELGTLTLTREEGVEASFQAAPGVEGLELDGALVGAEPVRLATDAGGSPSVLRFGTVTFFVIERGDRVAVRAKDSASDVRTGFSGIERFAVDPSWRIEADYRPRDAVEIFPIPSAIGTVDELPSPGTIHFTKNGEEFRLDAFQTARPDEVWFIFGDRTNADTTYGGGRFLYARFTDGDPSRAGKLTVDFNRAYNPPCVFTPYATCPLATPANRFSVAVEAGEKMWGEPH